MKLHVMSDIHLEFGTFEPPEVIADAVILAGDTGLGTRGITWALEHFRIPVIFLAGNHEYYRQIMPETLEALRDLAAGTNVHFLENDAITIGNIRFLGCTLWTDFGLFGDPTAAKRAARLGMNDYRVINTASGYHLLRPIDTERIHAQSVRWLTEEINLHRGEKTVIVTHHGPSGRSVPERYAQDILSASFCSNLDRLVETSGVALWIHGHTHDSFDYKIGGTRVIVNPRGYCGYEENPQFLPGLVVEV